MGHVHLYTRYPPKVRRDFVQCLNPGPVLQPGDVVTHHNIRYSALPSLKGDTLDIQRDEYQRSLAQVATRSLPEGDEVEARELVGAGAGSANPFLGLV